MRRIASSTASASGSCRCRPSRERAAGGAATRTRTREAIATISANERGIGEDLARTTAGPPPSGRREKTNLSPPRPRRVQLGVVPEDALLVERHPSPRPEVRRGPRPLRHPIAEGDEPAALPLEPRRRLRDG